MRVIRKRKIDKVRAQLEKLTVWMVPEGFAGGPATSNDVVPMVRLSEVMELLGGRLN